MEILDRSGAPEFGRSFDEPETEAQLYRLGFERLGAIGRADDEHPTAEHYDDADRAWFERHARLLTPVYIHPESGAFAEVSRFHGNRLAVRIQTALADGSVARTAMLWGRLPNLAGAAAAIADSSPRAAQTKCHNPRKGMSIQIEDLDSATPLFQAHQQHVAELSTLRGSQPAIQPTMAAYMRLQRAAMQQVQTLGKRELQSAIGAWLLPALIAITAALTAACSGSLPLAGFLVLLGLGWLVLTLRYALGWGRAIARRFMVPPLSVS